MSHTPITSPARVRVGYMKCEDGSATILSLFFVLIFIVMGGLAIDFNKVMSERTQLQVAADTAAHAALYSREFKSESESNSIALSTIDRMLPDFTYGTNAINTTDVTFGVWDKDTLTFTSDPNSRTAVRVNAQMTEARSNASRNLLLRIIGQDTFDVTTQSIYTTYYPPCFNEGFVADDVVDIQSNNSYTDGFCIHSNNYVSLNQNNYFEPGTVVSMPNLDNLDLPSSGFDKNEGLQTALRTGEYRMRLLNQLPQMIQSYYAGSAKYAGMAGITTNNVPIVLAEPVTTGGGSGKKASPVTTTMVELGSGKKTLSPANFPSKNRIYTATCSGNGDITFSAATYSNFVLVSNCNLKFANGVILDGTILATTSTSATSVSASHVQMGLNDSCAPGGGSIILTMGGFEAAAGLQGYGAQILAGGDIQFAANANGIEGVSFIAEGRIDGTSNMNMGFCDGVGVDQFLRAPYFRMVN